MPEDGLQWLDRADLLTYEELARIARVCVERWGFDGIRITGGEPTVRHGLARLFELLAPLGVDLAMTTNGVKLPDMAAELKGAGLNRVNVSLDSLRRETFLALTRRDELDRTLAGIDAALEVGMAPVKVNCVVIRGVNDDELVDLAAFGREKGVGMRFIEFMPLDAPGDWQRDQVVSATEIIDRIHAVFPLEETHADAAHVEPAARYRFSDGIGDIGVIASVTEPFCESCDRVRITAEGKFRTCLFALEETDLRSVMRDGGTDVVVTANDGPARLLLNQLGNRRPWIGLRAVERVAGNSDRDVLDAWVGVRRAGGRPELWRRVRTAGSYASASDPRL